MRAFVLLIIVVATGCRRSTKGNLDIVQSEETGAIKGIGRATGQSVDSQGHTPLHIAAINGDPSAASRLIAEGAPLDVLDDDQRTPLCEAAKHGHADVAAVLLDAKANKEAQCRGIGLTPLHIAGGADAAEVVKVLIEHGANVNSLNRWHQTPLHQTGLEAPSGVEPAKLLIAAHADLEIRDNQDFTPLLAAITKGKADFVRLLLDAGANPNATLASGNRAIEVANAKNHPELVPLLRAHGALPRDPTETRSLP